MGSVYRADDEPASPAAEFQDATDTLAVLVETLPEEFLPARYLNRIIPPLTGPSGCTDVHVFACFTLLRARLLPVKQNITLKLPTETLRRAKVLAAQRGTSLSALLFDKLQDALGDEAGYESARKRAFKALDTGWPLGGTAAHGRGRP